MKRLLSISLAYSVLFLLLAPRPALALFHLAVIDEVMTSYDGDSNVQFVEIKMLGIVQIFVTNTVLGAFDSSGSYLGDLLVVPGDIPNQGQFVRWLIGTQAFATLSGLTPDFIMPAALTPDGGMVCWGAPGPGFSVPDPNSWDHTDADNYVDCVAYGNYSGPTSQHGGTPTALDGDGHSLTRNSDTDDNLNDFICGDPATPENNAGTSTTLAATSACPAVCGNDLTESNEQCDGSDDSVCPGACQANCTCPGLPAFTGVMDAVQGGTASSG